jgi:transposase
MQADAYAGCNGLYAKARQPGPTTEAACWAHARRKFSELAELRKAPLAVEAVRRIDELETWLRQERRKLSSKTRTAQAIDYLLKRMPDFIRFLDDSRLCMSNNAAGAPRQSTR